MLQKVFIFSLVELSGDIWMHIPCLQDALAKRKAGSRVWLYNCDATHHGSRSSKPNHGSCVSFIFGPTTNSKTRHLSKFMLKFLTDFAKYGMPYEKAEDAPSWPEFESIEKANNLRIANSPRIEKGFHNATCPFWFNIVPHLLKS